jgi:hypothetical protein
MDWTPHRIATLRRMWADGASAALIAERLGCASRSAVLGKVHRIGLDRRNAVDAQKPKPKPTRSAPPRLCAVPGCGAPLAKVNRSAVCRAHVHAPGHCQCPKCAGGPVARRAAPTDRAHVRVALIAATGTVAGGATQFVPVSLRREPWVTS